MSIPFDKPCFTGKETEYIRETAASGKNSSDGIFAPKFQQFFQQRYGFKKVLLTTSCTDGLEMAAIPSLVLLYEGQRLWLDMIQRLEDEGFTLWSIQKDFTDPRDGRTLKVNSIFFRDTLHDNQNQ